MKHADFHVWPRMPRSGRFSLPRTHVGARTIVAIRLDSKDPNWFAGYRTLPPKRLESGLPSARVAGGGAGIARDADTCSAMTPPKSFSTMRNAMRTASGSSPGDPAACTSRTSLAARNSLGRPAASRSSLPSASGCRISQSGCSRRSQSISRLSRQNTMRLPSTCRRESMFPVQTKTDEEVAMRPPATGTGHMS